MRFALSIFFLLLALASHAHTDNSLCERLRQSRGPSVGVFGLDGKKNLLVLDETFTHGYHEDKDTREVKATMEPETMRIIIGQRPLTNVSDLFPGWSRVVDRKGRLPGRIDNAWLIKGMPPNNQMMVVKFNQTSLETAEPTKPYLMVSSKYPNVTWFALDGLADHLLVLGCRSEHYLWALTRNETGRACLVTVQLKTELTAVDVVRYRWGRCIEDLHPSPLVRGFYSLKRGHLILFHQDRTVSIVDSQGLGFQILKHMPYSTFFQCYKEPTDDLWKWLIWMGVACLAGVLLTGIVVLVVYGIRLARKSRGRRGALLSSSLSSSGSDPGGKLNGDKTADDGGGGDGSGNSRSSQAETARSSASSSSATGASTSSASTKR